MSEARDCFPEYGARGDQATARRNRRSFRFCVVACVLFAGMLWFSEGFLRYNQAETLYIRGLTLEPTSARVQFLNAIKIDKQEREFPSARYVEALAERAEDEDTLEYYAQAYELAPENAWLAIRYGCRLFQLGKYEEAKQRFQEAAARQPHNALPTYLEAASLLWTGEEQDLDESLTLVARANNSGEKVEFPVPLWHSSLPQKGQEYARLRRLIVEESTVPLNRFAWRVLEQANEELARGEIQYWETWLETLRTMAERLAAGTPNGTSQALVGGQIQLECVGALQKINQLTQGAPDAGLIEQQLKLQEALELLRGFEASRDSRIEANRALFAAPLSLLLRTAVFLGGAYLIAYVLGKLLRAGRSAWTLPHPLFGKMIMVLGALSMFGLLTVISALPHFVESAPRWSTFFRIVWWAMVGMLAVIGALYPSLILPRAEEVARSTDCEKGLDEAVRAARKCRRIAYASFLRRYFGILVGLLWCVIALWAVGYRMATGLYPWEQQLLVTGLLDEEASVAHQALAMLPWILH